MSAVLPEQSVELLVDRLTGRLELGRELAQKKRTNAGVLVAGVRPGEKAMGLFGAVQELFGALLFNDAGNPFEPDQQIAKSSYAIAIADSSRELRRDQRDDDVILRGKLAGLLASFKHEIGE